MSISPNGGTVDAPALEPGPMGEGSTPSSGTNLADMIKSHTKDKPLTDEQINDILADIPNFNFLKEGNFKYKHGKFMRTFSLDKKVLDLVTIDDNTLDTKKY